ncbi:hypothetical protein HOLDEFILI_04041 [Holdemania filiformis DSM 12042]|uniref:Uncharacterized protein n=1 Tax=Holdemania filiformis DSM 12042 TaxID=545696 RepID=B9YDW7_9FIRM|nr:hypothetical protein HOLDEFILI_04041 [Holdemania filiformis DSM 12042]
MDSEGFIPSRKARENGKDQVKICQKPQNIPRTRKKMTVHYFTGELAF